jgi:aminoglycoside phosphotransferase (APT) family kinase protein
VAPESTEDRIREDLRRRLSGARDLVLENFMQTAGGWSHETYVFDAAWKEDGRSVRRGYCLRKDPGVGLLRELSNLEEQFRVLKALESTPVPAPKAYWYEPDARILGGPFLIMEKIEGDVPNPWSKAGKQAYAEAAARGVLPRSFVGSLATLHNLDWRTAGLDFLGVPRPGRDFAHREIAKWERLARESSIEPQPVLIEILAWLKANAPEAQRLAFVHGAYRTGNLILHDDRVAAILDWELQVIGDPMYDVAYVLSDLNREGTPLLSYVIDRDLFISEYERLTGLEIDFDVCRYYDVLYMMRTAVFWISASGLFAEGRSKDLRLARTTYALPGVLDMAAKAIGF